MSRKICSMLGLAVAGSMLAMAASSAHVGSKAYVGNFIDNTVSVIDTSTGSAIATIPVATGPHGMAISRDGSTVYVTGDGSSSLNVIDTATDRVTKTIEVGQKPNGITQTLTTLHVRSTEYTVGPNGEKAMPDELPSNSAYTYATEFSVDEVTAVGGTGPSFNQPIISYNENFLAVHSLAFPISAAAASGLFFFRTR